VTVWSGVPVDERPVMKIQGVSGPGGPQRPDDSRATQRGRDAERSEPAHTDRVELSKDARRLAALVEAAKRLPEIRHEKVEELRRALADNSYDVDPRALARAVLEFEDGLPD
jgi:negative regulator of flagellin synthesis FlgM